MASAWNRTFVHFCYACIRHLRVCLHLLALAKEASLLWTITTPTTAQANTTDDRSFVEIEWSFLVRLKYVRTVIQKEMPSELNRPRRPFL